MIECRTGVALWEMVMFSRGRTPLGWSLSAVQNLQAGPARQNSRWTGRLFGLTQAGIARDLALDLPVLRARRDSNPQPSDP